MSDSHTGDPQPWAMQDNDLNLRQEAEHLYRCLFDRQLPEKLADHYIGAHRSLSEQWGIQSAEARTLHLIVAKKLNATAIEPWLRRKGAHHIVSLKLLLLVYLDECGSGPSGVVRNTRLNRVQLLSVVIRGLVGLLHGRYLKARHGLV
jgi:hypothetical protein